MGIAILSLSYLIASISFIIGLKMLSNPANARKGNLIAAAGMFLAIIATIFLYKEDGKPLGNYIWIFTGLLIGSVIGAYSAKQVKMTAMPEMVSLFNGTGGACAALISIVEFNHLFNSQQITDWQTLYNGVGAGHYLTIIAGAVIGTVSFAGSIISWGKLSGKIKDFSFKGQHIVNLIVLTMVIVCAVLALTLSVSLAHTFFYTAIALSLLYGVFFVLPIGGADMPVVISLLNSFTGVAAACGGFLYNNQVMLTGGILVGAAGTLLTILMCKAMNRSLKNVLIGSFGNAGAAQAEQSGGHYKEISINDAATLLSYANKVMIVPGYGLAVAQAQHSCHELEK